MYLLKVVEDDIFIHMGTYLQAGISDEKCMQYDFEAHTCTSACVCVLRFTHIFYLSFIWILHVMYELRLIVCE